MKQNKKSRNEPTFGEIVYEKLDDHFKKSLPIDSLRQLPRPLLYGFGSIAQIVFLGLFGYFIYSSYSKAVNQQYVSLDSNSGNCLQVGKPLSGQFYATYDGYWEGEKEFEYNQAAYVFTFSNLNLTTNPNQEFYELMMNFQNKYLLNIEQLSHSQTLPINLLYWMNYIQIIPVSSDDNQQQTFEFIGQPSAVFNTLYQKAGIASFNNNCSLIYTSSYNSYTGTQTLTIPLDTYFEESCDSSIVPDYLGYDEGYDLGNLIYSFDYNSFATAVAVNADILPIEYLLTFYDGYAYTFVYNNVLYSFTRKADPRFPGMEPIICIQNLTDASADTISNYPITKYCFIELFAGYSIYESLAIPIFTHYIVCYCKNNQAYTDDANFYSDYCNQFDLVTSIVVFSNANNITSNIFDLISSYNFSELTNLVYYSSPVSNLYTGDFSYCNNLCSILSINSYVNYGTPDNGLGGSVNDYYYQILYGSCNNSFYSSQWNRLASNPPTSLTESYYKCTPFALTALESAVGIANGNTSTFMPFLIFILLPTVYIILNKYGFLRKDKYSKQDKESVINDFAVLLLKLRDSSKNDPNSISDPFLLNLLNGYGFFNFHRE